MEVTTRAPTLGHRTAAPACSLRRKRGVLREPVLRLLQNLVPVSFSRANDGLLVVEGRHLRLLFDIMQTEGRTFAIESMQHCLVNPRLCD